MTSKLLFSTLILISLNLDSQVMAANVCQDKLKNVIDRANNPKPLFINAESSIGIGGFSIDLSQVAGIFAIIRANRAEKYLAIFKEAQKGNGPHLQKLWKKLKRRKPRKSSNLTFESFVSAIRKGDQDGTACAGKAIPKKKDLMELALEDDAPKCKSDSKETACESMQNFSDEVINKLSNETK